MITWFKKPGRSVLILVNVPQSKTSENWVCGAKDSQNTTLRDGNPAYIHVCEEIEVTGPPETNTEALHYASLSSAVIDTLSCALTSLWLVIPLRIEIRRRCVVAPSAQHFRTCGCAGIRLVLGVAVQTRSCARV